MPCRAPGGGSAGRMTVDALNEVETDGDNWLANIGAVLRQRWWLVAAVTLVAVLAAVIYLRTASYLYTAELRVYPAPSTTGQPQASGSLGGLASLAGLAAPGAEAATPFRLYLEGVRAREVAERLARDRGLMHATFAPEWDAATRTWHERRGLGGTLKHAVWGLLGLPLPGWRAPDAARLQDFITDRVSVNQSVKSPLVSVTVETPDPRFGVSFLTALGATTDQYLREQQRARTQNNIDYLSDKLRGVTLIEQRQALFNALNEQERQAMLANSLAPYAAIPFGVAVATTVPTTPRQVPLLLAGLVGGLVAGVAVALLLGPRRRRVAIIESA